jgi:YgiT-type zinc finger domain-containing protein
MTCLIGKQGQTQPGCTTVTLEREGFTVVFKQVPAEVCDTCGEAYLSDEISAKQLETAEQRARAGLQVDIELFDA